MYHNDSSFTAEIKMRLSVAQYVIELRRLTKHCEFKYLDEVLCDRLVCGLQNETIQRTEHELNLKKA